MLKTYYRRHKKSQRAIDIVELEQCYTVPSQQPSPDNHNFMLQDTGDKSQMLSFIKVGGVYEIDHVHLPPTTPVQLKYVRVAIVCGKTERSVSVRYPSTESLRAFFSYSGRETHPALDAKFVMSPCLAVKVLVRSVPVDVFQEKKCLETFWLISLSSTYWVKERAAVREDKNVVNTCLSDELKCSGMVKWGIRRQVKYLGRHKDNDTDDINEVNGQSSSSDLGLVMIESINDEKNACVGDDGTEENENEDFDGDDHQKNELVSDERNGINNDDDDQDYDDGDDDQDDEAEEDCEVEEDHESDQNMKRRYPLRKTSGNKKPKMEEISKKNAKKIKKCQPKKSKTRNRNRELVILRNAKDRWSAGRYKLAEQNLLEVMKSKRATVENPILRPQLRADARKKIGDTGLLDHLLKHMANKLAPGGHERFRRRHNPEGAMEYWLEDPNLIKIRKEAGVSDPFWVPPLGWKPGDSPNQDPICANELRVLRDDIANIRRDVEMMATKMHLEGEVGKLRRELVEFVASTKMNEKESQAIVRASNNSIISQKEKFKEQLMNMSDIVKEVEKKIGILTSKVQQESTKEQYSALIEPTQPTSENKVQPLIPSSYKDQINNNAEEGKAAKIHRLKSGFRICRPQGSFLWPNMAKNSNYSISITSNYSNNVMMATSPQALVQVQLPTPPSVSSSLNVSAQSHQLLPYDKNYGLINPTSPVKPRAVKVTLSSVFDGKTSVVEVGGNSYSSTNASDLINLNNAPMPELLSPASTRPWKSTSAYHPMMKGYSGPMPQSTSFWSPASNMTNYEGGD